MRIIKNLSEIDSYIQEKKSTQLINVIVVNDGSLDDTEDVVNSWILNESKNKNNFSLIGYSKNRGKGYAIKEGFEKSKQDFILYTDADGASPVKEIEKLFEAIDSGFDVVCGSRILKDKDSSVKMSIQRRIIGLVFHLLLGVLGLDFIGDTQCGFKLFKSKAAKELISKQKCFNFSFDIEYLYLAKKINYKIKEVPINWHHVKGSKVNVFIDSIKMFAEVLKIRFIYKYNI